MGKQTSMVPYPKSKMRNWLERYLYNPKEGVSFKKFYNVWNRYFENRQSALNYYNQTITSIRTQKRAEAGMYENTPVQLHEVVVTASKTPAKTNKKSNTSKSKTTSTSSKPVLKKPTYVSKSFTAKNPIVDATTTVDDLTAKGYNPYVSADGDAELVTVPQASLAPIEIDYNLNSVPQEDAESIFDIAIRDRANDNHDDMYDVINRGSDLNRKQRRLVRRWHNWVDPYGEYPGVRYDDNGKPIHRGIMKRVENKMLKNGLTYTEAGHEWIPVVSTTPAVATTQAAVTPIPTAPVTPAVTTPIGTQVADPVVQQFAAQSDPILNAHVASKINSDLSKRDQRLIRRWKRQDGYTEALVPWMLLNRLLRRGLMDSNGNLLV